MTESNPTTAARAWAEIDLAALAANARTLAQISGARLLPMVKANAYGLGAVETARALESLEPWGYGVATTAEARTLRVSGLRRPIVVFAPLDPSEMGRYLEDDLRPSISSLEELDAWTGATERPFHVEVDTGMARTGIRWDDGEAVRQLGERTRNAPGFEGIWTHFHSAATDPAATARQWETFLGILTALPTRPPLAHAANSAAAVQGTRYAADLVRPGIFLYGGEAGETAPTPETVVRLRARVVAVRDLRRGDTVSYGARWRARGAAQVATLGIGYADGVLRSLGRKGKIELGGALHPIAGVVTMDFTMIAVTGEAPAVGEVATVFGGALTLDDQARVAGTIAYELLTALGGRVERRYRRAG